MTDVHNPHDGLDGSGDGADTGQAADGGANFIFVGAKMSHKRTNDNTRSLLMREYYRRKKQQTTVGLGKRAIKLEARPSKPSTKKTKSSTSPEASCASKKKKKKDTPASSSQASPHQDTSSDPEKSSHGDSSPEAASNPSPVLSSASASSAVVVATKRRRSSTEDDFKQPFTVFYDPLTHIASERIDADSSFHFRRWMDLPRRMFRPSRSSDADKWVEYALALVPRFPIVVHGWAACSSRQIDGDKPTTIRIYNQLVKMVNSELTHPTPANYDSILLGIQGALASSFLAADPIEFELHRRGRQQFLSIYGPPRHPDVMVYVMQNSFLFGRALYGLYTNPLQEYSTSSPATPENPPMADFDQLVASHQLVNWLQIIYRRSISESREALLELRPATQKDLFEHDSTLHRVLWEPIRIKPIPDQSRNPWRKAGYMCHHPFVVLYLTLLHFDYEDKSSQEQEREFGKIATFLTHYPIDREWGASSTSLMLLMTFKEDTDRAWRANHMLHVLMRLSDRRLAMVLEMLAWHLCLDTEPLTVDATNVKEFLREVEIKPERIS